jgi:steroid delta-isomerase-like uncharacterized protein
LNFELKKTTISGKIDRFTNLQMSILMQQATQLIQNYYQAFNSGDMDTFLSLLTDDVIHDINQGGREIGKEAFGQFMQKMNHHYKEELVDMVVMANEAGTRGAAEFVVLGEYLNTDEGLPEANGQTYKLPAGAFFEIRDGKVARITNYYNLGNWIEQVDPQ